MNSENSTMSRTVNNVVNSDLVKRDIDPQDRRYVNIILLRARAKSLEASKKACLYYRHVYNAIGEESGNSFQRAWTAAGGI